MAGSEKKKQKSGFPIFFKERLPKLPTCFMLKMYAEQEGSITTTQNCKIKVFLTNAAGKFRNLVLNSNKILEKIKEEAVKNLIHEYHVQATGVKGQLCSSEECTQTQTNVSTR